MWHVQQENAIGVRTHGEFCDRTIAVRSILL